MHHQSKGTSSWATQIPVEILHRIFNEFGQRDLWVCALVCRRWRAPAQSTLYEGLWLHHTDTPKKTTKFSCSLEYLKSTVLTSPALVSYVRRIRVSDFDGRNDRYTAELPFLTILEHFGSLQELTIQHCKFDSSDLERTGRMMTRQCPFLIKLTLDDFNFVCSFGRLATSLDAWETIKDLTLSYLEVQAPEPSDRLDVYRLVGLTTLTLRRFDLADRYEDLPFPDLGHAIGCSVPSVQTVHFQALPHYALVVSRVLSKRWAAL